MKKVKFGNVASFIGGGTPDRNQPDFWGGDIPWASVKDLKDKWLMETSEYITESGVKNSSTRVIAKHSLIIATRMALGRVAITQNDIAINQDLKALKLDDDVDMLYCYNFLNAKQPEIENLGKGATVKGVSLDALRQLEISIPPLDEQRRIAAILDKADAICRKRQEALKLADAFVKSVFLDMFGDPVLNPKGWEKGTVRDLVQDVSYGTSKPAIENGKFVYLRMNNITYGGHLDLKNLKYIDVTENEFKKYSARKGDVLFNRTNSKELVGKTCVFYEDTQMIIAGYIIRVRTNNSCLPEYLSATLNSSYGKSTLLGMCKQIVGQANINAQELQNIKILLPPPPPSPLQNQFAKIVQRVEAHKQRLKSHLTEAEHMKKALQQRFFG